MTSICSWILAATFSLRLSPRHFPISEIPSSCRFMLSIKLSMNSFLMYAVASFNIPSVSSSYGGLRNCSSSAASCSANSSLWRSGTRSPFPVVLHHIIGLIKLCPRGEESCELPATSERHGLSLVVNHRTKVYLPCKIATKYDKLVFKLLATFYAKKTQTQLSRSKLKVDCHQNT